MGQTPVLSPSEVIKILKNLGFKEIRQKASHKQFRHSDGRQTTVPLHKSRDLSPILIRQIAKDIKMTVEEMLKEQ